MTRYFLFISVAILRIKNARLRQENEFLRCQIKAIADERNAIMQQYFEYVRKSA